MPPKRFKPARPSRRLAAAAASHRGTDKAKASAAAAPATIERPTKMQVRTKFVVVDKQEAPVVVAGALQTRYQVRLAAAYEPRSILNGLATEQGNGDNRIFGSGVPEAAIALTIESKAIADTFVTGHAFAVDFVEIVDA